MKKALYIFLILILATGSIGGCGTTGQSPESTARSAAATTAPLKIIEIRSVGMFGGTDPSAPYYQQLIKNFMAENPDIIVTDESATVDETWKAKVLTDFSSGNDPDVAFYFNGPDAKQLIENKKVVSIEQIRKTYPEYAGNISDAAMGYMKEFDGNHYAVPIRGYYEGLFCNRDLFEKYNLQLPTNWDNLIAAITTFKANGIIPFAASFSDMPHYWIEHLVLAQGGYEEHQINPKDTYPESWAKALGYFKTLYDLGAFPVDVNATKNDIVTNMFYDKKAAMQIDGSWFIGGIKDPDTTIVIPFPATPDGKKDPSDIIGGFSSGFYISTKAWYDAEKQSAVVKFTEFMTSNDAISAYCQVAGSAAADVPASTNHTEVMRSGVQMLSAAKNIDSPIDNRATKEAWTYLVTMIGSIADGSATPEDVLTQFVKNNQ